MTPPVTESHDENTLRGGIRPLLFPRSAVMIGATDRTEWTAYLAHRALASGIPAWGVNPNRDDVAGLPCFPSVAALPELPELAFVLVGHGRIEAAVSEALDAGVRAFVIPGLGAESGAEGPPVATRVAKLATEADAAVVGPNCMGVAVPGGPSFWIGTVPESCATGHVSAIAHSGSIGEALLALGGRVGLRCVVSSGGELVRDAADLCAYFAEDEATRAVGLFLETIRRPAAFVRSLELLAVAGKPAVCLKTGRSEAAARATLSHTGALVGSARAFSAMLRRVGAIEVDDYPQLVETLEVLGRRRLPRGTRIAAVSNSGGEGALLADAGHAAGLPFEPLGESLVGQLTTEFPNYVAPGNPLDAWAIDDVSVVFPRSLELLAGSGEFDILLAHIDQSQFMGEHETANALLIAGALADAVDGTEIFPAVTSVQSADPAPAITALARERDVALLRSPGNAMRALAAVVGWRKPTPADPAPPIELGALADGPLPEHESALVLERYGIAFAPRRRAASAAEAAQAAAELGCPVVVKIDGPAHKAAEGGVALGIETPEAAAAAAERLGGSVLVAKQLPSGVEAFCGMARDPAYGPIVAVGLGGAAVEALSLAATCLAPIGDELARELVEDAPGLAAVASETALDAIARAVFALGRLAIDHPEIAACDVNPLILSADGAVAVDALVIVDRRSLE